MSNESKAQPVREAVGIFFDKKHLEATIDDLLASGFKKQQFGLLASEYAVEEKLGDIYTRVNEFKDSSEAPVTAFVKDESVGDTFRSLEGGLIFAGSTTAMGGVVATASILGGAMFAAVSGAVAVAAIGILLGTIIHQSDAEYLEEQVDEGHLLLFVRVTGTDEEELAVKIMAGHSGYDARIHEISAHRRKPLIHR